MKGPLKDSNVGHYSSSPPYRRNERFSLALNGPAEKEQGKGGGE